MGDVVLPLTIDQRLDDHERRLVDVEARSVRIEQGQTAMSEKISELHGENRARAEHAEKAMERGFAAIQSDVGRINSKLTLRSTIIAGASGLGGGVSVGLYALLHSLGKI
ncbi:hypothetical protein ACFFGF_04695 [Asaia lannensis]|uniref:Uncharacterized protein n=1 Tax=Asaia lannensis NBRC 102526 TaxID=1307926 RepID=A0ABT1CIJ1_9PROT|nr:hypothetical protein [Asaia lannensis]MCO6160687.1 hypothetical protein [Asaia lannensis NBRC 102526]GBR01960.1 hypothetical protein AA102526_2672 [Asaia lannensis NBRC 102526]